MNEERIKISQDLLSEGVGVIAASGYINNEGGQAIADAAIDVGGRPYAVLELPFRADRIGTLSTQMIEHALEAFTRTSRSTLHLSAVGRNDHHVAEAAFKALARALRLAVEIDDRRQGIASTKGTM